MTIQLDKEQQAVADDLLDDSKTNPLRIIACAGSGKTRTVVEVVGRMLDRGADPESIVLTTFTAKAARELKQRVAGRTGNLDNLPQIGTFHSLALRWLRNNDIVAAHGWNMQRCIDIANMRSPVPQARRIWWSVLGWSTVLGTKHKGLDLEDDWQDYASAVGNLRAAGLQLGGRDSRERAIDTGLPQLYDAWCLYEESKHGLDAWDFQDALVSWLKALKTDAFSKQAPRFVFVDEAQDNSMVQLQLAQKLAQHGRLVLVGDGAQSIYRWRGAYPEFLLDARKHVPGIGTLSLPNNYRSGAAIVKAGNVILTDRAWNHPEPARSGRDTAGLVTRVQHTGGGAGAVADAVAEEIAEETAGGVSPGAYAILTRTNADAGLFEMALVAKGIPVTVVGKSFFSSFAVEAVLSYVLLSLGDYTNALAHILNRPKRYIPKSLADDIEELHRGGMTIQQALIRLSRSQGKRKGLRIAQLSNDIAKLRSMTWPGPANWAAGLLIDALPKKSKSLKDGDSDVGKAYKMIAEIAGRFQSGADLIAYVQHAQKQVHEAKDPELHRVTISTIHRSKGLEWDRVYVPLVKDNFPHAKSMECGAADEEERLLYVAVTRARDELHLRAGDTPSYFWGLFDHVLADVVGPEEEAVR